MKSGRLSKDHEKMGGPSKDNEKVGGLSKDHEKVGGLSKDHEKVGGLLKIIRKWAVLSQWLQARYITLSTKGTCDYNMHVCMSRV